MEIPRGYHGDFYRGLEMTLLRTGNELAHTSQNGVGQNDEKEIYSVPYPGSIVQQQREI